MKQVAIIGVGNMGSAMARCLLGKGYLVRVIDVDRRKTDALCLLGAIAHPDASTVPAACSAVIVCVVDRVQVEQVLPTITKPATNSAHSERAVILCPTIAPEDVERFAQSLTERGLQSIDCPMSGGPARAECGTMSLMVACPDAVYAQHQTLLHDLSNQVFRISGRVGDGARMKLVNNLLAGIHLAGTAESIALAERIGLDARTVLAVLQSGSAQSWIAGDRMSRALAGDFAPRAHMTLLAKDTQLALAMARKSGVACHIGTPASQAFVDAASSGYADLDDAALLTFFQKRSP
ncbi:MAG: NAD(P)-dependent oxidoreductase [Cytophagales bacterium]|nr:NAD(P)-dependent oxidoreductase [Cytophagales bacterium]